MALVQLEDVETAVAFLVAMHVNFMKINLNLKKTFSRIINWLKMLICVFLFLKKE